MNRKRILGREFINMKKSSEEKEYQKKLKKAKSIKRKVQSTLTWMDIDDIVDDMIILKKGNQFNYVKGIKVSPHQIFLDTNQQQAFEVERLRIAHNKIMNDLWWGFVFTPVDLNQSMGDLLKQMDEEDDEVILSMIDDDLAKAQAFINDYRELEFFIMIKMNSRESLNKAFNELREEFENAGRWPKELGNNDFKNYISYVFENNMINDYFFSQGVFQILAQEKGEKEDDEFI